MSRWQAHKMPLVDFTWDGETTLVAVTKDNLLKTWQMRNMENTHETEFLLIDKPNDSGPIIRPHQCRFSCKSHQVLVSYNDQSVRIARYGRVSAVRELLKMGEGVFSGANEKVCVVTADQMCLEEQLDAFVEKDLGVQTTQPLGWSIVRMWKAGRGVVCVEDGAIHFIRRLY